MSQTANDLQTLAQEQQTLLMESRRRLGVRDRIDGQRRSAQRQAQRERLETITSYEPNHKGEIQMSAANRPSIFSTRLPLSGNAALWASALIQAVIGIEFALSSLNKLADPHYVVDFAAFVRSTPGAMCTPWAAWSDQRGAVIVDPGASSSKHCDLRQADRGQRTPHRCRSPDRSRRYWPAALRRTARRPARLRGAARAGFGTRRSRGRRAGVIDRHPDR